MKFKARLEEPRAFLGVLQICRSIQRDCIVRLQSSRTRFFTSVDILDGVQVWMGCRTDYLFSDFRCDSHYKEHSITCEILSLRQLMHILKQAEQRQHNRECQTVVRLARHGGTPILKLTMQGAGTHMPDLSYDVPIRVLTDREIERMQAPPLEDNHVQVIIPSPSELATFVDKLKSSQCESVTFCAQGYSTTLSGGGGRRRPRESTGPRLAALHMYAENSLASFTLRYDGVEMIPRPRADSPERDGDEAGAAAGGKARDSDGDDDEACAATVVVEVKKFARFFSAVKEMNPTRLSMYLVDQSALVLSVQAAGGTTMVAYIPARRE